MAKIVVVGGCIIDLISYVDRFPKPGETMSGNYFCKGFGGKGANQCVMADKLGAQTALIAKLGSDSFGYEYLQNIKEGNIVPDYVTMTNSSHTSTASISVTSDGQNNIIYVPGAIMHLTPEDVLAAEDLIKNANILLCTYECPLDTLMAALNLAKRHKVKTIVNAAPATDFTYENLYPLVDIICLNEVEAEEATKLHVKNISDATDAVEILQQKNCSTVILTLGDKGAIFKSKEQEQPCHVPARSVKAIDSTGAGDAFVGSLAYFFSEYPQLPLKSMIQRSCEIATFSVLKKGTQTSFPNRNDIPNELFLRE